MDALAQLQKAQNANKALTMAEKQQLKEFAKFSKALTSSMPSRMARGEETASSMNPDVFLYKAANLQRQRRRKKVEAAKVKLPAHIQQVLDLQITRGKRKGQWKPSNELRNALGGILPKPQSGIPESKWTTAVVLAFLRRHPDLFPHTREAYHAGSFFVPDDMMLQQAANALPPLKGSWVDLVGSRANNRSQHAIEIGEAGLWRDCVEFNATTHGYLPFSNEEREARQRNNNVYSRGSSQNLYSRGSMNNVQSLPHLTQPPPQPQPSRGGIFTREAEQRMKERIAAAATKIARFKTDAEYLEEEKREKRRNKRQEEWNWRMQALKKEFKTKSQDPGKAFLLGERVKTKFRRASEWDRPRITQEYHPARIVRLGLDGQSVDIEYLNGRKEIEKRVSKIHVEADMIEFARMSIEINKRNYDRKMKAKAIREEQEKFEAELRLLKEATKSKKKKKKKKSSSSNNEDDKGEDERESNDDDDDDDDDESEEMKMMRQQMLEEQAKNAVEVQVDEEEEQMRLHEGLDMIANSWSKPLSLKQERKRLKSFMEMKKVDFNTRVCAQSNPSVDTKALRRDHTDLREIKQKRKVVKKEKTMNELLDDAKKAQEALEAKALNEVGAGEKARVVAGGKKNELIRKQFEEEQRKKRERLQKLIDSVTNAEDNVVACILKHEANVLDVQHKCDEAVDRHARAALKTEQIHAFDDLTETLNKGRNINCDLVEAVVKWREAKLVLAKHRGEEILEYVEYDKDSDKEADELGALSDPSALPFLWNGNNILLHITNDFDFLINCHQLTEWYGPDFNLISNPFMLAVPVWERASTPLKATQSVLVNGVQVERIIPRLRDRSERQAKALMAQKARQKKSAWWWPGHSIRPAEYERVRRAEKEIFNEKRRIGLKPKGVPR